jgi:hypothetical protein
MPGVFIFCPVRPIDNWCTASPLPHRSPRRADGTWKSIIHGSPQRINLKGVCFGLTSWWRYGCHLGAKMPWAIMGNHGQLFQQAKLVTIRSSINGPPKIGASCDCCVHSLNGILEKLVETYGDNRRTVKLRRCNVYLRVSVIDKGPVWSLQVELDLLELDLLRRKTLLAWIILVWRPNCISFKCCFYFLCEPFFLGHGCLDPQPVLRCIYTLLTSSIKISWIDVINYLISHGFVDFQMFRDVSCFRVFYDLPYLVGTLRSAPLLFILVWFMHCPFSVFFCRPLFPAA